MTKCYPSSKSTTDICIYDKYEWGGRKNYSAKNNVTKLPVSYVVVSQTNGDSCFDYDFCMRTIKGIQTNSTGIHDNFITCNFFIGGDGNVYEDSGWNMTNSLPFPANEKSLYLCLLGNPQHYPTYPQIEGTKHFIKYGLDNNYLSNNYVVTTANATSSDTKVSPEIYNIVKKWPKFKINPFATEGEFGFLNVSFSFFLFFNGENFLIFRG